MSNLVHFNILILLFVAFSFKVDFGCFALQDEGELIFANVLFRHGDRTPLDPYPNDPYKNESYWPVGFGQLTNIGKEQEYELGQWMRRRYDALLTEEYSPDIIHVESTDVDRCLMSAALVFAGMYPPTEKQRWNPRLNWQPVPIHSTPLKLDKVLAARAPCPAWDKEMEKVLQSKEIQELNNKYSDVYKILSENCGKNISNLQDLEYMYSTLFIEDSNNLTLPAWTKDIYPNPLEEASKYSFALQTWTLKLARLKTGLLVEEMISHLKNKADESHPRKHPKVWMYSAHDTTIGNLLNTLGVFDPQNPPYSSAVMMELRRDSQGQHHVMLFYRNSSSPEPYVLTLPGCNAACPLDQFSALCEAVIPQDWESECQLPSQQQLPYNNLTKGIAASVMSCLLILILVVSVLLYRQKRKQPTHRSRYAQFFVVPWEDHKPFLHASNTDSGLLVPQTF